jgi:tartrate dehydrogenase/decarboxylase/D-malate dehydrogenase
MMLDFLGYRDAHDAILTAIEAVLHPGSGAPRTRDMGGSAGTEAVGEAIAKQVLAKS